MNEDKSTRYHRLRRRTQVASLLLVGTLLAAAVAVGAGPWLRSIGESAADGLEVTGAWRRVVAVAAAAAVLAAALEVVAAPGAYYLGFVLERRYGLSRQSRAEWCRDHVKAGVLGLALSSTVALVVYGAIDLWAGGWWLVAGVALGSLAALLALGAPIVLLPLFYRFEPLPAGELPTRLQALAKRAGTPVLGVYAWALGDKTRSANAALVGLGPTRRILLSDTLIDQYSPDEIEVIIAHELAHHVHGDIWKGVLFEGLQGTMALLVADLALMWIGPRLGVTGPGDLGGMPLLALVAAAWSVLSAPLLLAQSRTHERRADRFALELTGGVDAFVSAMRRLGAQNLADDAPSRLVEWLFHSHPPLGERIAAARRWAQEHGALAPARS